MQYVAQGISDFRPETKPEKDLKMAKNDLKQTSFVPEPIFCYLRSVLML